ncbi:MAG: pyocin knob domain-containing protein [Faecousia sp.]
MANLHLVTGYAGQAHVTAEDHGSLFDGAIRGGNFVLAAGNKFSASAIAANTIRVLDGELVMRGRHVKLDPGSYVDLTIETGAQGYSRNDLIVARYTRDSSSGIEECNLVVIKGTAAESSPEDPAYTTADPNNTGTLQHDFPLYRVPLTGVTIGTLVALFTPEKSLYEMVQDCDYTKTGLGGIPPVASDLNTKADTGWWVIGDNTANRPTDLSWGLVQVIRRTSAHVLQEATSTTGRRCRRVTTDYPNSWGEWEWENPTMALSVEYRTTEKFYGKPVYVKTRSYTHAVSLTNTTQSFGIGIAENIDDIVRANVYAETPNNDDRFILPFINLYRDYWMAYHFYKGPESDGNLPWYLYVGHNYANNKIFSDPDDATKTKVTYRMTVYYTKTTD